MAVLTVKRSRHTSGSFTRVAQFPPIEPWRLSFPVVPNQSPCSVASATEPEQTNGTVAADDDNQKKSGPALLAYIAYKS
jgi:hypothetical protein